MVDAPLEAAYHRAREHSTPLFVNDVDVGTGDRAPLQCNLKFAPVLESSWVYDPATCPARIGGMDVTNPNR